MWKAETRCIYDRKGLRYPTDMTDAEWDLARPFVDVAQRGPGRRRWVNLCEVLNAVFYVLGTGCQWRALPKGLPPRSTVHDYFVRWQCDGTLRRLHHALYEQAREIPGKVQDRDGCLGVLKEVRRLFPFLERVIADGAYQGKETARAVRRAARARLEIVKRCGAAKGFTVLPKRWIVERTFGWLGRRRRLAKDFEALSRTHLAFVQLALIRLMMRRIARASQTS